MSVKDDLKGKGSKALFKLEAIQEEVDSIGERLEEARELLQNAINSLETYLSSKRVKKRAKRDSEIRKDAEGFPKRVQFECNDLNFYIDFATVPSESSDPTNIQGIIIYGARRALCLADRIMKGEELETKALIQFSVNRQGMIQSNDALEDTWSLRGKEHDLLDMHCRALDSIWGQALAWRNENILP